MANDSTFVTLLTGAAIGAFIGVLYAPDEGIKTRKKIRQKALETKRDWESRIYRASEELTKTAHNKNVEFESKLETSLNNMSRKGDEIIAKLEKNLAELQKKNAQFKK